MKVQGIMPNQHTYSWLLGALRKEGRVEEMEVLWDEMTTAGSPWMNSSPSLRDGVLCTGVIPDTLCYNEMLKGCSLTGSFSKCKRIYDSLCQSSCSPDASTFLALYTTVCVYISKGHWIGRHDKRICFALI